MTLITHTQVIEEARYSSSLFKLPMENKAKEK